MQGIKSLQTPSIYIGAVIFAFLLYHIDRREIIQSIFANKEKELNGLRDALKADREDPESSFAGIVIFIAAVIITTMVLAVKKVYLKRAEEA